MAGNIVKWWRQFKQYKQFSGKKSFILSSLFLCAFFVIAYPKYTKRRRKTEKKHIKNHRNI
jgi:hypothetical protein